jgi:hypothetical protein
MSMDPFEKHLQNQPLRTIPGEWRNEILAAAHNQEADPCQRESWRETHVSIWQFLLVRFPVAGGALAAVWATIIIVNLLAFYPGKLISPAHAQANQPEPWSLRNLQRIEFRQLVRGEEVDSESSFPELPGPSIIRPQGKLCREWQV